MTPFLFLLALLIPTAVIALRWALGKSTLHPGFTALKYGVALLVAVAGWGSARYFQTTDHEYWTGFVKQVVYRESYTETVTETDSKGRVSTRTVHHGPSYWVESTSGGDVSVDRAHYLALAKRFGCANPPTEGWLSGNGVRHRFAWPGDDPTAEVVTTAHPYANPTQLEGSVWRYEPVSQEDVERLGLHNRPGVQGYYHVPCVLGCNTREHQDRALELLNARLGAAHQVRVWLLVFRNKPVEAAVAQEALWKGGKKNELVLCVGLTDDFKVEWARAFSWSQSESIKADWTTVFAPGEAFDIPRTAKWLERRIPQDWKRREFAEFDYIRRDTPGAAFAWTAVAMLLCVAAVAVLESHAGRRW